LSKSIARTNPALIPASFSSNLFTAPQSHSLVLFIHQINPYVDLPIPDLQPILDTLDEDFSQEEVAHPLKKAPHLSSPGPYEIYTCPDLEHLTNLLTHLSILHSHPPLTKTTTKASTSHVILLHKSGCTDEVTNYRPLLIIAMEPLLQAIPCLTGQMAQKSHTP